MIFKSKISVTVQEVLKALTQVIDPGSSKDIVSLGYIKDLKIQDGHVSFLISLPSSSEALKERLKTECEANLKAMEGIKSVKLDVIVRPSKKAEPSVSVNNNRIVMPTVRSVIAVASGKGGVGKSTVTTNLAIALAQTGARIGLLDADVYGPSIPMMLGTSDKPLNEENRIIPVEKYGIKMMSIGFLIPDDQPVVWRGPRVHGVLTQFLTQLDWGHLDYLLIDLPPGTGDAQLTISQNAPVSGAIIVTTPQEVSLLDARRGALMFSSVNVPILGVVENMAGLSIPGISAPLDLFGKGGGEKFANELGVPLLASLPIDPKVTEGGDSGIPVVLLAPEAPISKAFQTLAGQVASEVNELSSDQSNSFQPVSLQWQ